MTKSKNHLRHIAQNKSEAALQQTDELLRGLMDKVTGDVLRAVTRSYSQVVDALSAIDATYQDPDFTPMEIETIRRMAAAGKPIDAIRRRIRRNMNRLSAYMRRHGLHQHIRA